MPVVTIQTVAEYAQVSRATVSRVLNNNPSVDPQIRDRVLEAAHTLGYQPNRTARRLRMQSKDVIGVIISDIQNPYFTSVIRGIEDAAYAHQMNIVLCNSDEDSAKQQKYARVLQAESVAGLIVSPAHAQDDRPFLEELKRNGIAIIILDRVAEGMPFDAVKVDNVQGAYDAVQHLIERGRRRIGIIYPDVITGRERYQGYNDALEAAGLPVDPNLALAAGYTVENAYQVTRQLLQSTPSLDALFAGNDMATLGVLRACRELSVRIPDQIGLVGFDDMPWAEELYCPPTVVAQPTYDIGQQAVHLLRRRLEAPGAPIQTVILQTQLIIRQSSGIVTTREVMPGSKVRHDDSNRPVK
jgi:DNA-binding LacI/PurR family transcriptional regulator